MDRYFHLPAGLRGGLWTGHPYRTVGIVCVVAALIAACVLYTYSASRPRDGVIIIQNSEVMEESSVALPKILSAQDQLLYTEIFANVKAKDWNGAQQLTRQLSDPVLVGHVLAEQYLSNNYTASYSELASWLDKYADHPEAYRVYTLALNKKPATTKLGIRVSNPPLLRGYGDDNGLARNRESALLDNASWDGRHAAGQLWKRMRGMLKSDEIKNAQALLNSAEATRLFSTTEYDVARWNLARAYFSRGNIQSAYQLSRASAARSGDMIPGIHWLAGLAAWQLGDTKTAAHHFDSMARKSELLSPWQASAAAFWAYRAYDKLGNDGLAQEFLEQAAIESRTFYGIIARKALDQSLELDLAGDPIGEEEMDNLYANPGVRRTAALTEIGHMEMAEQELRKLFPDSNKILRRQLLQIAYALDLPAVQIPMAKLLSKDGRSYDYAVYPLPSWQPSQGFDVDPALLFAFARQESGFYTKAQSNAGARGLMQIMPNTAHFMVRQARKQADDDVLSGAGFTLAALEEPITSLSMGQSYIAHLMGQKYVQNNLFFLAAAYNAGPGKLLEWQKSLDYRNDPLLFVESIPYSETRNYVTQVVTNYWIYSEIITGKPVSLSSLLNGGWPQYAGISADYATIQ